MELFIDSPHVAAHGVNADAHLLGNFFVGISVRKLIEETPLAGSQSRNRIAFRRARKVLDDPARELGRHRGAAAMKVADSVEQAGGSRSLEQVAAGPGLQ